MRLIDAGEPVSDNRPVSAPATLRPRRAWALVVAAFGALLTLLCASLVVIVHVEPSYEPADSLLASVPDVAMALAFASVGGIVTIRRPGNLVGWALSLAGGALLFSGALSAYAELALLARPEAGLPAGAAAGVISAGSWTALMAGVFAVLLVFPTGSLPSPRWRPIARLVLAGFALSWVMVATAPVRLDPPFDAYENPLAVTNSSTYLVVLFPIIGGCLLGVAAAAVNLLLRFRRSRGREREQYKLLTASAGLLLVTLPLQYVFDFSGAAGVAFGIALIAMPVSIGIAILRYRLYEIDRIIHRTVVYGLVTALLTGLYFGIVIGLQEAFSGLTRGNDLAIAASTLAAAALFRPARTRIQAFVDRRFYRRRYDAEQTLAAFSARLRDEIDLDSLGTDLAAVVRETMQPAHLSLWLAHSEAKR